MKLLSAESMAKRLPATCILGVDCVCLPVLRDNGSFEYMSNMY